MSKSFWTASLWPMGRGFFLIGFATRETSSLWTSLMTSFVYSAALLFIGVPMSGATFAKPVNLRKPSLPKRPGLRNRLAARHIPLLEEHFKQGIAVYEVQPDGNFHLTHLPANYDQVGQPVLTMGIYDGHAFLIRDIKKVTRDLTCGDCQARFAKPCDLVRHATSRCSRGQTKIICPNKRIPAPASAYEKAFYPEDHCSFIGTKWLEWEAQQRGIHIHHARCGHGGERHILGARVDGCYPETKTIFQFHGCFWHGCKQCYPDERKGFVQRKTEQGNVITRRDSQGQPMKRKDAYGLTLQRTQFLRDSGYTVVEKWEHEKPTPWATTRCPEKQTETYPHAIVYDFEAYQDKSKAACPTRDLSFESEHLPISVSIADTLNPEPEYIASKDPGELIHLFYQSLERRYEAIRADVVDKFGLPDIDGITESQGQKILQWFNQVPVLGFNSGHYDLKLIRKYFVPLMAQDKDVFAAEKNGRIMLINTPKFKFLDVMNYLAPGITYDKWVKTYGATLAKSWLPYEWFDSADKLDYLGLPPLLGLVFSAQGRVRLIPQGVRRLPAHFPRAWHANLRRLARVLQQPGRCPLPGSAAEDEGVLHQPWSGHLQGRGLPPGCIQAVHLAQDAEEAQGLHTTRVVRPQQGGVRHAKGCGGRRPKSCIHAQARGGRDPHSLPPIRGRSACQAHPRVRRQFALPQHHDEGDALRSWVCHDLQPPRGSCAGAPASYVQRGVVWLRGGGHRGPQGVVARVRGVSPTLHQPQCPRQRGAAAHARPPATQRAQALP